MLRKSIKGGSPPVSLPPSLCDVSLMCEAAPRCCPSITLSLVISLLNWPVLVISSKLRTSKPVFNEEGKKEQSRGVEGVTCDIGSSPGAFRVITCTITHTHTHTHTRKDWAEERERHRAPSMQRHPCKTFTHTHTHMRAWAHTAQWYIVTQTQSPPHTGTQLCMGQVKSPCVKGRKQEVTLRETEWEQR